MEFSSARKDSCPCVSSVLFLNLLVALRKDMRVKVCFTITRFHLEV